MANRKEERKFEIDLSQEVHEIVSSLEKETPETTPALIPVTDSDHFQTLVREFITEELDMDPEVHDIFLEHQVHVLVDRSTILGSNKFQLLDDGFTPKNPFCHPELHEDDYSEESLP